ncbi:MAG: hypothetical protein PHV05_03790 [Candidatus Riflebacteria bacterium]|nr:hypothetical protein [Candidatus Riflebacteria bacterium]
MSQSVSKGRGKTRKISVEAWQRARDLVASGRWSLRDISKECGIVLSTLARKKNVEHWYDPKEEAENIPPPPPKLSGKKDGSENLSVEDLPEPPKKEIFKDTLAWCQSVLSWALEGVARRAQYSITAQCFLVEKLPSVIKSLAAVGPGQGTVEEQTAALREEVEDRLANIKAPKMREFDRGQEPEKQRNGKS